MTNAASYLAAKFGFKFAINSKELSAPTRTYLISLLDTPEPLTLSFHRTRHLIVTSSTSRQGRSFLPLSDIRSVRRVEDEQWTPSRLKYFLFDLGNASVAGTPVRHHYTLRLPGGQKYSVNFLQIISMERLS